LRNEQLEAYLRGFEMALEHTLPTESRVVARLDGRGFTRLTRQVCGFDTPFDERFRDLMAETCRHLFGCGFNILFAYSESDEISLLFHPAEDVFGRKAHKWVSLLAGEASGSFSVALGRTAAFDCRLAVLPGTEQVVDYFRWRMNDAIRGCLNAHAYWTLRAAGLSPQNASARLWGMSAADKKGLLDDYGISPASLPRWQTLGFGVYRIDRTKRGRNPVTAEETLTSRRRLRTDLRLPSGTGLDRAITALLEGRAFPALGWPPTRIVSGGQTGADRAALDWAVAQELPHGGWVPRGRRAEDGIVPESYRLRETASGTYRERTRRNVEDSDATLVFNLGALAGGTRETVAFAEASGKPWLVLALDRGICREDIERVHRWLAEEHVDVLNVAGPRESKRPGVYRLVFEFLDRLNESEPRAP